MAKTNNPHAYAGLIFPPNQTAISKEIYFIEHGGQWKRRDGGLAGLGLFEHYKRFIQLLWPSMVMHRWFLLILKEYLGSRLTSVIGCKDAGKTESMAMIALADYYVFPHTTLAIVSSTNIRGLELRVYGAIKRLHSNAKSLYPWLPGQCVDSKHAICTDDLEETDVRVLNRGIICIPCIGSQGQWTGGLSNYCGIKQKRRRMYSDECFPAGTLVDTPTGPKRIERIQVGDTVLSAIGPSKVLATSKRTAIGLVTVTTADGRKFSCTPNHPILTQKGWINAIDLNASCYMLSQYEAMQILQSETPSAGQQERGTLKGAWLASVEIAKQNDSGNAKKSHRSHTVYNLSVEGHPSYSVNGLLVHNCSFMKAPFLDALANLNSGDFKGMFIGNPLGDGDPLDKLSEPKGGWGTQPEPETTTCWDTVDGRCINLIGTDSPNFDYPQDEPPRFPFLIHKADMDRVAARWGVTDWRYLQQCMGLRITGIEAKKVITRDICYQFHALEQVFWFNETRTKVYGIDAAYGNIGGDRCVGGWIEFGRDVTGKVMLRVNPPVIIPVKPAKMAGIEPEEQIAIFVRNQCEEQKIPPDHVFYDATGRGSLGTAFARAWSADVNPIEFGGNPTDRPITSELMIKDPKTGEMRLMKASERFSKFVTELWWTVRYIIESDQMRELPQETMDEGCRRLWEQKLNGKIEIESKVDMKDRVGYSPDYFDHLACCCEGARRVGFQIAKMNVKQPPSQGGKPRLLDTLLKEQNKRAAARQLTYR